MKTKYQILSEETVGIFDEHEADITCISNAMDIYATQMCLELLEYMAKKGMMCFNENGIACFTADNGFVILNKEQLFENFL